MTDSFLLVFSLLLKRTYGTEDFKKLSIFNVTNSFNSQNVHTIYRAQLVDSLDFYFKILLMMYCSFLLVYMLKCTSVFLSDAYFFLFLQSNDAYMKDFKRKYCSTRLWGSPNDNRRVRLKLTEKMLESQGPRHIDLLKNIYQNETSKFTSAVDEGNRNVLGVKNFSCTLQAAEISSAPAKSSVDLLVEYQCSEDAPQLPDGKTVKSSHQTSTDNSPSVIIASKPEEAVEAVESTKETACPTISPSDRSETKIEGEPSLPLAFNEDKVISVCIAYSTKVIVLFSKLWFFLFLIPLLVLSHFSHILIEYL